MRQVILQLILTMSYRLVRNYRKQKEALVVGKGFTFQTIVMSGNGYTLPFWPSLRDGEFGAVSGPPNRFRLLYARLRTSIGRGL